MTIPTKKLKSGFEMPVFGIGTWQMGGRFERNPENNDAADIAAIRVAIDWGVTHIDTAESYADGHAERLAGEAIKGQDRGNLFIVSKVSDEHLRYDDVIKAARASRERLGTAYLDLYLIHAPNPEIPIRETMRALDTLLDSGLIRHIGVSNFSKERIEEAQSYTKNKIVANQVHYNLIFREPERKGLIQYCQAHDIMFIAWRPVEKGALTKPGTPVLDEMCIKYGKTPAQIAINWLISQPGIVTLAKTTAIEHLKENLGAVGWTMNPADIERLRTEFPNQQDISDTVPLI
ncbi:aldo/keto reductase [Candidatus Uhrbacteria bacterium]|nr:aldo/keto reductase [Candidatus Uhrbacteria bacterium]